MGRRANAETSHLTHGALPVTNRLLDDIAAHHNRREAEVLRLVTAGATNAAAARELRIASGTVKKHLDNVYAKLAVSERVQAAALVFDVFAHHN